MDAHEAHAAVRQESREAVAKTTGGQPLRQRQIAADWVSVD
jgi:hypothetical protein